MSQPNFKHLLGSFYVVRTQAGLEQAIKDWLGESRDGMEVTVFPKSYPSVICLSIGYNGSQFIRASAIHVNALREAIKDQ